MELLPQRQNSQLAHFASLPSHDKFLPDIGNFPLCLESTLLDNPILTLGVITGLGGEVLKLIEHLSDVQHKALSKGTREIFSDHHAKHRHVLGICRHCIGWDNPPKPPKHL
uniref:Uncharacterized protein n=1 Tax=Opuntia streptacantha TaxID=393608 RepID=A0A7C8ZF52_OPUST